MLWGLVSLRVSLPHIFVFQSNQPKVGRPLEVRKHFRVKTSNKRGKQDGPSLEVQKLFCTVLWFLDIVHPGWEQKSISELDKAVHCTAKFKKFKFHKRCDRAAKNQSLSFLPAFLSQNPCGQNQCQQKPARFIKFQNVSLICKPFCFYQIWMNSVAKAWDSITLDHWIWRRQSHNIILGCWTTPLLTLSRDFTCSSAGPLRFRLKKAVWASRHSSRNFTSLSTVPESISRKVQNEE